MGSLSDRLLLKKMDLASALACLLPRTLVTDSKLAHVKASNIGMRRFNSFSLIIEVAAGQLLIRISSQ